MIPRGAVLDEFKRLWDEAAEVSLHRDEFLQLVFKSAVDLAEIEKSKISNFVCEENQGAASANPLIESPNDENAKVRLI